MKAAGNRGTRPAGVGEVRAGTARDARRRTCSYLILPKGANNARRRTGRRLEEAQCAGQALRRGVVKQSRSGRIS